MATNGQPDPAAVLARDAGKGAAVHTFDPAAAPEEKGAQAGKARSELKKAKASDGAGGKELQVQNGSSAVVPTITVEDAEREPRKPAPLKLAQPTERVEIKADPTPGAFPVTPAPAIPDWYRVGWRQLSEIDKAPLTEGEEVDKGVLDAFLSEQFYGSWYHNAAVIIFAVFASHFLTRFSFGWGWLFVLLAFCSTYYSTSLERVRRRARDDIQRELVKTRLASEHESADWINNFLDRFWLIYEPVLAATVVSSVDQVLSTNTPAFLDSIRLSTFTLGTKAPRIDKVRTYPKTEDDVIMMDWGISFTPTDVSDLTPRQAATKVNPKIVLDIRLGKSVATATMPILVEDICFSGLMRIRMKLMSNFPHVQIVDFCFLEKPVIDYVLKPIGGETFGFDIGHIPGLSAFIRELTHGTLGPMMYDPNVFTLNLEQLLSGKPLDTAIGVLQVTLHSARGIQGAKIGGGTPDPYIALTINDRIELARTKYKHNTYNPTWMETKFLLVQSLNESLVLNLYDYNEHRKDNLMGSATFELSKLIEDATHEGIRSTLLKDGKERGELRYDVSFYPVLEPVEGEGPLDTSVGIVRLTLHQAKDLDHTKSITGDLNPMAKVYLDGGKSSAHATPAFKHTNNPVWESAYEFLCSDRASSIITVKVLDDRDFLKDPVIGYMSIKLQDLLDSMGEAGRDWFPLSGCKTGKIRVSAEWKPLNMAGSLHGADQYTPPIGVVKLWLDRATDVKNVEATLGGKSDPYVRVLVNNVTKARTEVKNNNLNPVWDEIVYIPVHSLREHLLLECMDYQHLTRDRSLGSVELLVNDLAKESADPRYPFESLGQRDAVDPIRLDKGNVYKGQLHYKAEFIPALALNGVSFDSPQTELASKRSSLTLSTKSSEEPVAITIKSIKRSSKGSMAKVPASPTTPTSPTSPAPNGDGSVGPAAEKEPSKGVDMSVEELLRQQSGVAVFNVVSGELHKKARVEVLLDDGYWPCFSTPRARSTHAQWAYVGEGFIKEIDFSRVWLRLNEADEGEKDDIIAEWRGDAKSFLQATLIGPQEFTLLDKDERNASTVRVESRYVPVPVKLEPRETINNQGILHVDLIDGRNIIAADRSGKSDPYAVFTLNGDRVFKSEVKKKTLSPEWNERFALQVPSRFGSDFELELFDWDAVGRPESLGKAKIDLNEIEPFEASERTLNLATPKHGEKGYVRVRLMFQPEMIAKTRKNTSTFSTAGRAMTQIGGLPVSAGKGVFHGVANVFKRGDHDREPDISKELPAVQAFQSAGYSNNLEAPTTFPVSNNMEDGAEPSEPGTLRVTVLSADLTVQEAKPYATIRVGDKEFKTKHVGKTANPEWNEAFTFAASPQSPKLYAWIHDHKTLGRDKDLDEGELDIWRTIQPRGISATEVPVQLRQGGLLKLRLEYDPSINPSKSSASIASSERQSRTISMSSPSRFSIARSRRPGPDAEE
ncbi:putative tricalbin [Lyophyllum shimeji]|uniref:Tricalbin n=1 Tax=Lyophyllum shimeji TaxID=47721 RepID=A0A9P3PHZ0_LYOSH|nr:putative tricalbin [Lyophyllum shimeji]